MIRINQGSNKILIFQMFQIILLYLESYKLPFYWNKDSDMFAQMTIEQKKKIHEIFRSLSVKLEKNVINGENYDYLNELICN